MAAPPPIFSALGIRPVTRYDEPKPIGEQSLHRLRGFDLRCRATGLRQYVFAIALQGNPWRKTAQQLSAEKQRRRREEARRRKEQALAQRDRLAAELQITAHQAFPAFAVPAQQRPLVPLPENRKASFREHLERIIQEAFAHTDSAEAPSFSSAEENANGQDEVRQLALPGDRQIDDQPCQDVDLLVAAGRRPGRAP